MIIVKKSTKEVISVLHNNATEMRKNIGRLQEEGWSENTRISIVGIQLCRERIYDIDAFRKEYPNITIHHDKPGLLSDGDYVYHTIHEREIGKLN